MWDVESAVEVLTLRGASQRYGDPPFNARILFHPNGRRLAAANWNESISVWDAPMPSDKELQLQEQAARRQGAEERAFFWHLEEAEYCVEHKLKYGARFHRQRLSQAQLPPLLQERRDGLVASMEQWKK
jgi:hypothetical protein